jgi:hypothetical protein
MWQSVVAVRSAITGLSATRMTKLRDDTGDIVMRHRDVPPDQVPADDVAAFMENIVPFLFLPADRAIISSSDVAEAADLSTKTAAAVTRS